MEEARHWIITHSPAYERKAKQWASFKAAKEMGTAVFGVMGSRKDRRYVTMGMMKELFTDMQDVLIRKAQHMALLESKFD
ncbi:MAG: hypothetical protein ACKPKO_64875, partial [Candidatus Fonsibacter sp.]